MLLAVAATATWATTAAMACGPQYMVDVRCYGAGSGSADDSGAINAAARDAVSSGQPLLFPPGSYRVSHGIAIDYAASASTGFRLISMGAVIDGTAVGSGPVLQVTCSGGNSAAPEGCFYFKEEGSLFVNADTSGYAVVIGNPDFSDAHNSIKIDHLIVNNRNPGNSSGGVQLNYVLDSELFVVADAAGGGAGIALEQVQFSMVHGAGSATLGTALLIENGYTIANTIQAVDLEVAAVCVSVASPRAAGNSFVSPYFDCPVAVFDPVPGAVFYNPVYSGKVKTTETATWQ